MLSKIVLLTSVLSSLILASVYAQEQTSVFGGISCYEPVRRCNTGYSNRDCPPCY